MAGYIRVLNQKVMKQLMILLAMLTAIIGQAAAQCTPDSRIGPGEYMYPKTLGDAMAGYYYYQVITLRIPSDSNIVINGNTVHAVCDSSRIIAVVGLPTTFSYSCNPASCTWTGGSLGCALIQGLVAQNDSAAIKEYRVSIGLQTWFHVSGIPYNRIDTTSYTFKVHYYSGLSEWRELLPLRVYPNPSEGSFSVEIGDLKSDQNLLQVFSIDGRLVKSISFGKPDSWKTTESVVLPENQKGLFLVRLQSGNQTYQQKVFVN